MKFSDEVLMAYADGELDLDTRQQVEASMADPEIARRIAAHTALRATLRSSFDRVIDEPIPERLLAAARANADVAARGNADVAARANADVASGDVIPLRRKPGPVSFWPKLAALAASFILGAVALKFATWPDASGPVTERNGQLLASGELARALTSQLTSNQPAHSGVQIGTSFRSKDGNFCRTRKLHLPATRNIARQARRCRQPLFRQSMT
jgi:anti-sigma factor RsiW